MEGIIKEIDLEKGRICIQIKKPLPIAELQNALIKKERVAIIIKKKQ